MANVETQDGILTVNSYGDMFHMLPADSEGDLTLKTVHFDPSSGSFLGEMVINISKDDGLVLMEWLSRHTI